MDNADIAQINSILEPFVNTKIIVLKDLLGKLFPATEKVEKIFNRVLNQVAKRLDEKHNIEYSKSLILQKTQEIKRSLIPYGHLESLKENLAEEIHFDTLPEGYYEDFKSLLFERLLVYQETRVIVAEYLQALQIDAINSNVEGIPRIEQSIDKVLQFLQEQVKNTLFSSKDYHSKTPYFIQRRLTASSENIDNDGDLTLSQIIETGEQKRIALVNYAGNGKSVELEQLASWAGKEDSYYEPLLIKLGSIDFKSQTLSKYLDAYAPGWNTLQGNLLLILDALDEVNSDIRDDVKRQIISLSEQITESTLVVSSRTNAYQLNRVDDNGYLTGFTHFELPPFSDFHVWQYLTERFSDNHIAQQILDQVSERGFRHDITTPFYLVRLSDYYGKERTLPVSKKELFEYLIDELKNKEKIKSSQLRDNIEEKEILLDHTISKIAITLQLTGESFIKSKDFIRIVDDPELVQLVKQSYLLDSGAESKWRFEHNNFKEYLAAKHLAGLSFSKVKQVLFVPQLKKVNPNWLNTLGFLMSYLDKNSSLSKKLVNHIRKYDPESLVRIEKDKINLEIREEVFFFLLDEAVSTGTFPNKQKFYSEDLGKLVSDSENVCKYLVAQINDLNESMVINLCCYLLRFNDYKEAFKVELKENLIKILGSQDVTTEVKDNAITALKWFNIYAPDLSQFLLNELEMPEDERKKALYHYYVHTEYAEDHIGFMIEWFVKKGHHHSMKYELLYKIQRKKSFATIITKLCNNSSRDHDGTMLSKVFEELYNRNLYSDKLTNTAYMVCKTHHGFLFSGDLIHTFLRYAEKGNLVDLLFTRSLGEYTLKNDNDALCCLSLFLTEANASELVNKIKREGWETDRIKVVRNNLYRAHNKTIFNFFYERLNKEYDNQFLWGDEIKDPYRIMLQKEIDFVFDKAAFIQKCKEFLNSDPISRKKLYNDTRNYRDDPNSEACRNILGVLIHDEYSTLDGIFKFIENKENWESLRIRTLYPIVSNYNDLITKREEDLLKSWAKEIVSKTEIEDIFQLNEDGSWICRNSNMFYAAGISEYYNLTFHHEMYLKLLQIDCQKVRYIKDEQQNQFASDNLKDSRLLNHILSAVNDNLVEQEIVKRLNGNEEIHPSVLRNHLRFLRKLEKPKYAEFFYKWNESHFGYQFLAWYLELDGDIQKVHILLNQFEYYEKSSLIDAIIKRDKNYLSNYLFEEIHTEKDQDRKETLINQLLMCEDERAIGLLKQWIIENKRFTRDSSINRAYDVGGDSILLTLKEIYEDSIKRGYGHNRTMYDRGTCLDHIRKIAINSKTNYDNIYQFLAGILKSHPERKELYGVLDQLEFDFYSKQNHTLSLDEALKLAS